MQSCCIEGALCASHQHVSHQNCIICPWCCGLQMGMQFVCLVTVSSIQSSTWPCVGSRKTAQRRQGLPVKAVRLCLPSLTVFYIKNCVFVQGSIAAMHQEAFQNADAPTAKYVHDCFLGLSLSFCVYTGIGAGRPVLKQEQPAADNMDEDEDLNAALRQKSQQRRECKQQAAGKPCC